MSDDQIINQIAHSFSNYNLRDIEEITRSELHFTIAGFILCSCFIDQLSGFRYKSRKVKSRYIEFVKNYLPKYDGKNLYEDLRNKLVHNYSVGSHYSLTSKAPQLHLQKSNNLINLNLEDFIKDLKEALDRYIEEVKNNQDIRKNALDWFHENGIIKLISNQPH